MPLFGFTFGRDPRPLSILVTPAIEVPIFLFIGATATLHEYLPIEETGSLAFLIAASTYGLLWLQYWQQKRRLMVLGIVAPSPDDLKRTA